MTEDKKRHRHGSRFRARRRAVDILFEAEFRDTDPVEVVEQRRELSRDPESQVSPIADYTASIVLGVATALDEIDDTLAAHLSSEWTLERLPAVDRAILRVSAWELLHNHENVPDKVAVDEGIGLAKEYGHDKAPVYVHAVLDSISRDRRRADEDARAAAALAEAAQAEAVLDESSATGIGQSGNVADDLIASILTDDADDADDASQATVAPQTTQAPDETQALEVTRTGDDSPEEVGNGVERDATAEQPRSSR